MQNWRRYVREAFKGYKHNLGKTKGVVQEWLDLSGESRRGKIAMKIAWTR